MKAFLLAAGTGSRLRPLTDVTPKCLLSFDGSTLLDLWLDGLARAEVDEVLVNVHHLPDVVREHLSNRAGPPIVHTVFEPELLGSAGTLVANRQWVRDDEMFVACNADNLTDFDLRILIDFHRGGDAVASLTLFHAPDPSACGVVEVDRHGNVVSFTEKPRYPASRLANAGIYAFHPCVIDEIDAEGPQDIGYDLLPKLVGRARAFEIEGYFRDIGTLEAFDQAQRDWRAVAAR